MSDKTYYDLLNVSAAAELAELTTAFHRKLKEINDRNTETRLEELRNVIEAYAILSNSEKRQEYDHFLKTGEALILSDEEQQFTSTSLVERIRFETTGKDLEQQGPPLIEKVDSILKKIQDHTVRLKYRGQQVGPDIPLGYAIALEALGLMGAGMVRTVVTNLGIKTLFEVEFISKSEEHVKKGDEFYQQGEIEEAKAEYLHALSLNEKSSLACLRLGVLHKVTGFPEKAREWFTKACDLEPESPNATEAKKHLDRMA